MQEYEFTPPQERVITGLTQAMTIVAVAYAILAVLLVLGAALGNFLLAVPAVIFGLLASRLWDAKKFMNAIVEEEGSDVQNLMVAMSNIKGYFKIMGILFLIVVGLLVLALLLGGGSAVMQGGR